MPASKIRLETSTDTFHVWLWSFHDCFLLPTYFPPSLHLLEETLPSKQCGVFRQLWNWHLKTKFPKTNQKSYNPNVLFHAISLSPTEKKTKVPCLLMASCNSWNFACTSTGVSAPWWLNDAVLRVGNILYLRKGYIAYIYIYHVPINSLKSLIEVLF